MTPGMCHTVDTLLGQISNIGNFTVGFTMNIHKNYVLLVYIVLTYRDETNQQLKAKFVAKLLLHKTRITQ